ncbi:MAG: globin domain-containing protein [Planctomycetales bacterium]
MTITQSVQAILSREVIVTDLFYDIFLDRHPAVRDYFVGVDLTQQAAVLRMMLLMIEHHYTQPTPAARHYLQVLGQRHAQRHIPPELFPHFRDCLLETLGRFHGSEWSPDLKREWHAAIDAASKTMLDAYSPDAPS